MRELWDAHAHKRGPRGTRSRQSLLHALYRLGRQIIVVREEIRRTRGINDGNTLDESRTGTAIGQRTARTDACVEVESGKADDKDADSNTNAYTSSISTGTSIVVSGQKDQKLPFSSVIERLEDRVAILRRVLASRDYYFSFVRRAIKQGTIIAALPVKPEWLRRRPRKSPRCNNGLVGPDELLGSRAETVLTELF